MSVCPACHHHLPPLPMTHVAATSPTSPPVTMMDHHSSTTSFEWRPKELLSPPPLVSTSHHVTLPSWHITPSCHVTATCPTSRTCHVTPACRTRPPYVCGCALSHELPPSPAQGHLLSPVSNCGGSLTVSSDSCSRGTSSLSPLGGVAGDFGAAVEHRVQFNHSGGGVVTSNTGTSGGSITDIIADDLLCLKLSNLNSCPTSPSIPTVCVKRGSWPNHTTQFADPNSLAAVAYDTRPRKCSLGNFHASACGHNCVCQHLCLFNSSNNFMEPPSVCPQQLLQQQQQQQQLQQLQQQQQLQPPKQEPSHEGVCTLRSHSLSRQSSCPNSSPCLMSWTCSCLQQHQQHHRFSSSECLEQIPCQFTNFSSAHQHKQQQGSNPFLHQQHLHSFHLKPSDGLEPQNNNLHCSQPDVSAPTTAVDSDNFVIFNSTGGGGLITERRTPSRSNSPEIKFTISLPPGGDSSLPSSGAASPSRRSGEENSVSLDRAALMRTLASLPFVSTSSTSSSPLYGDTPSNVVRESPRDAVLFDGSRRGSNDPSLARSDSFIHTAVSQSAAPSSQSIFLSQGTNADLESSPRPSQSSSPINFHQHQPTSSPSLPPSLHATSNATFQDPSGKLSTHNHFITSVNNFFMSSDHHPSVPTTVSVSSNFSKPPVSPASCVASVRNLNSAKRDWSSSDDSRVLRRARAELEECGWYYGGLTWQEAGAVLAGTPEGTFLIRDSWSGRCLYALSVQTSIGPTSVRIEYEDGLFRPESETGSRDGAPQKPSVVALVQSYMRSSNPSHVWVNHFGQTVSAITVRKPLRQKPASLRHLARLAFNSAPQDQALSSYRIPNVIIAYLKAYPHWC